MTFLRTPAEKVSLFSLNFCESEESEDEERVTAAVTLLCAVPGETLPPRPAVTGTKSQAGQGWGAGLEPLVEWGCNT